MNVRYSDEAYKEKYAKIYKKAKRYMSQGDINSLLVHLGENADTQDDFVDLFEQYVDKIIASKKNKKGKT
jgi:hypothetical protein